MFTDDYQGTMKENPSSASEFELAFRNLDCWEKRIWVVHNVIQKYRNIYVFEILPTENNVTIAMKLGGGYAAEHGAAVPSRAAYKAYIQKKAHGIVGIKENRAISDQDIEAALTALGY